ncbi:MAG: class I SAM-dependent methyltransferase [Chloroflexi bacterium]|nr:class I SAM-dependent methyltransferase [Chloroflexota bacterium]
MAANINTKTGAAIYVPPILKIYDLFVYGFSSPYAWRCPGQQFSTLYDENVSSNHLEIGCGTGYWLDRCHFPNTSPKVALADLNPNSLEQTSRRIERYHPQTFVADVLRPLPINDRFDSIGMNYVLHCVPGNIVTKSVAFDHLKEVLNPGGVVFGSTIPFYGVTHGLWARVLLSIFNRVKTFNNTSDNLSDLNNELSKRFVQARVWTVGSVALFVARNAA